MLKPTVEAKEFEKYGFKRCKDNYGKNGCYYLCVSRGCKMLLVSNYCFTINDWDKNDPRIHKHPNCRYSDNRDYTDIIYELIKDGMLKSEIECATRSEKKTVTKYVYLVAYANEISYGNIFIYVERLIRHEDEIEKIREFIKKEKNIKNVVILNYQLIRTYEEEIEECE